MKDKEVMQQALEALRDAIDYTDDEASSPKVTRQCADAIAALESALAQPVQPSFTHDDADRLFGRPGDCDCLVAYGNICSEETEILAVRIEAMKAAAHDLVDRFALAQPVQQETHSAENVPEDTVGNRRAITQNPGSAIAIMQRMERRIKSLESALAVHPKEPS